MHEYNIRASGDLYLVQQEDEERKDPEFPSFVSYLQK